MIPKRTFITGMGVVSCHGIGNAAFRQGLSERKRGVREMAAPAGPAGGGMVAAISEFKYQDVLGQKGLRSFDRLTLELMTSLDLLFADAGYISDAAKTSASEARTEIIVGTLGPMKSIFDFEMEVVKDHEYVSPALFPNTVYCAAASYGAIRKAIRGGCITLSNGETSSLDAVGMGAGHIVSGAAVRSICGGAEELSDIYSGAAAKISGANGGKLPILGEGAVLFSLESDGESGRELAEVVGFSGVFSPVLREGYAENLERLEARGQFHPHRITDVFPGRESERFEHLPLAASVRTHRLYRRFGFLNSLTGSMAIAVAIADDAVPVGALILINNFSAAGCCSSLVLRKIRPMR